MEKNEKIHICICKKWDALFNISSGGEMRFRKRPHSFDFIFSLFYYIKEERRGGVFYEWIDG